jgi:hypothetical protein
MAALVVLGMMLLVAGVAALGISLPERAWDRAMARLGARIRAEAITQSTSAPPIDAGPPAIGRSPGEVDRSRPVAPPTPAPPATSLLDSVIDTIIEVLRRLIGSRGFPRRALRFVGVILIAVALLFFLLSSLIGSHSGGEHDDIGPRHPIPAATTS